MNEYFDLKAENYLKRSNSFIWSRWRKSECFAIEELLSPSKDNSFLDLGSGAGYYSIYFREKYNLKVLAVDSSPNMIRELQKNSIRCVAASVEEIKLDEKFDYILAAGVFEFIKNPDTSFQKIYKHLKTDGKFVILIPNSGFWGFLYLLFHKIQNCPTNIRNINEYKKMAEAAGFKCLNELKPTIISRAICFSRTN